MTIKFNAATHPGRAGNSVRPRSETRDENRVENIEGRVTRVTRPSKVDKPNREARSTRPTQAPPLMNAQCFACKGCYITSRKGYSTSGPGKVTIHRPGLSPLPPMNVPRLITIAEIVSRAISSLPRQIISCFSTFLSMLKISELLIQGFLARTCASLVLSYN